jgi:hypothetical protein
MRSSDVQTDQAATLSDDEIETLWALDTASPTRQVLPTMDDDGAPDDDSGDDADTSDDVDDDGDETEDDDGADE